MGRVKETLLRETNLHTDEPNQPAEPTTSTTKKHQYVVHFNNHGEILRHYTWASTHKQAMAHAAHQISRLLGVSPASIANQMKRPNSVSVINMSKGV